jgi:hypothetical protein
VSSPLPVHFGVATTEKCRLGAATVALAIGDVPPSHKATDTANTTLAVAHSRRGNAKRGMTHMRSPSGFRGFTVRLFAEALEFVFIEDLIRRQDGLGTLKIVIIDMDVAFPHELYTLFVRSPRCEHPDARFREAATNRVYWELAASCRPAIRR